MQEVVMQLDFVVPAAGTAAQLRVAREWELPSAADCPALHEFLPEGYGEEDFNLFCGHNSEFVLTREEWRGLRELVPYHAKSPTLLNPPRSRLNTRCCFRPTPSPPTTLNANTKSLFARASTL